MERVQEVHVQHDVDDENGVLHDHVAVVILVVDIMEQVHEVRHQMHVEIDSIVQHEQVVVQQQV